MASIEKEDIDFSRGAEEIVFIKTPFVTMNFAEKEEPRKAMLEELEKRGLKLENVKVIGIFKTEVSIELTEESHIFLDGESLLEED